MSINTTFFDFFKIAAARLLRFLKVRNISCWSSVLLLFTILCVRTQKCLPYASSAIFGTCYSLSVLKNCLTYVQPSRYIYIYIYGSMEWAWPICRARITAGDAGDFPGTGHSCPRHYCSPRHPSRGYYYPRLRRLFETVSDDEQAYIPPKSMLAN